jgi:putative hemolysin
MSELTRTLVVLGLIAVNAILVVGEYATVTARRSVLRPRAEVGGRGAAAALRLMDDPVGVISTVQVGITAVGILAGAVGEPVVRDLLGDGIPRWAAFLAGFLLVTYLMVVLGELVPKALTLQRAESMASLVARPIELLGRALHPIVWALRASALLVLRPLGTRRLVAGEAIRSADELRALIDEAERAGVIPRAQEELLYNVFDFASREVQDVMVRAPDVDWLDAGMSPEAALDLFAETAHARFPVASGSLDRVVGVVHAREALVAARSGRPATVGPLARTALIIPETKDLGVLLRELRERRDELAIVVSEYGATAGIVTLHDVAEEIIGEIADEYELPDERIRRLDDRTIVANGSMTVDDFNEMVGTALPADPRTLAGLVFDAIGRAPAAGDSVTVAGVRMRVEQVDGARITRIRLTLEGDRTQRGA